MSVKNLFVALVLFIAVGTTVGCNRSTDTKSDVVVPTNCDKKCCPDKKDCKDCDKEKCDPSCGSKK